MTYAAQIFTASGQPVIGNGYPTAMVWGDSTVSGSVFSSFFSYSQSSIPNYAFPAFVRLNVGDFILSNWVGSGSVGPIFFSNRSSLEFKTIVGADELPDPTGFDLVVRNETGVKEWVASYSIVTLLGMFTCPTGNPAPIVTVSQNAEWVAPLTRLPAIMPLQTNGIRAAQGVQRVAANQWQYTGRNISSGPNASFGPHPQQFLLAI